MQPCRILLCQAQREGSLAVFHHSPTIETQILMKSSEGDTSPKGSDILAALTFLVSRMPSYEARAKGVHCHTVLCYTTQLLPITYHRWQSLEMPSRQCNMGENKIFVQRSSLCSSSQTLPCEVHCFDTPLETDDTCGQLVPERRTSWAKNSPLLSHNFE